MKHGYFLRIHEWTAIIGLSICLFWSAVTARNTEPQTVDGASRGQGVVKIKAADGHEVGLYTESHALVIGASEYRAGWPPLPGVKTDVAEVERALKANGFEVQTLSNPTRSELKAAIDQFIDLYGFKPDNRLLIYFAGHGHTLKAPDGRNLGFIVPVDAPDPAKDLEGFNRKAVGMQEILNFARRIQA